MTGKDFIEFAAQLSASDSAAACRSCISRAYYGAFHVAREILDQDCGVVLPANAECHVKLQQLLECSGYAPWREAGRKLNTLRSMRNKADYDLSHTASDQQRTAVFHLMTARDVVHQLQIDVASASRDAHIQEVRNKAATVFRLTLRT